MYLDNYVDHERLSASLMNDISGLRSGMIFDPVVERRFLDDDMAIDDIMKLSFMISTNDEDFKKLPKWKDVRNATVKHDLSLLIERYGKRIMKSDTSNLLFIAFVESSPLVFSDIYKGSKELLTGLYALAFAKFILNMSETDDFINEMMKSGL
jgi:hypothetical protein